MQTPSYILLYVDDTQASAAFYSNLLGREPVQSSPVFVLYVLETGLKIGLWAREAVEPAGREAGGAELGVSVSEAAEVDATYADLRERGVEMLQPPTDLPFGRTFLAADPDGHRIRVFSAGAPV